MFGFKMMNDPTLKIGKIIKTADGRIMYAVDLEDTPFLQSIYNYKNSRFSKLDNDIIELKLWDLEQTIGMLPNTLANNPDEEANKIREQIRTLIEEE